ncbi:MAG: hypothetical protein LBS01_11860 [Prevotellaceae bacterium]|jgi:hypothetical protein|nr:hypothetical protein [Prevotellaceae bacterium]
METTNINSLQALRERKKQIGKQLARTEQNIKYGFYLYTHPVEWAVNTLTGKNLPVTSRSMVKLASTSSRFIRYAKIAYSIVKFFRKRL